MLVPVALSARGNVMDRGVHTLPIVDRHYSLLLLPLYFPPMLRPPQIYFKNQTAPSGSAHPTHLPLAHVLSLVIDSFTSATERHIEVSYYYYYYYSTAHILTIWPFHTGRRWT